MLKETDTEHSNELSMNYAGKEKLVARAFEKLCLDMAVLTRSTKELVRDTYLRKAAAEIYD